MEARRADSNLAGGVSHRIMQHKDQAPAGRQNTSSENVFPAALQLGTSALQSGRMLLAYSFALFPCVGSASNNSNSLIDQNSPG